MTDQRPVAEWQPPHADYEYQPPVDHGRVVVMDFFKCAELAAMGHDTKRRKGK
jgi:hypothetical protein